MIKKYKNHLTDAGLLILRLGMGGFLLLNHGLGKVQSFNDQFHSFSDPIGMGSEISYLMTVFTEFFCSFLVMIGFFTRLAVVPIIILFLVIAFIVHANDPFSKVEFALIYAIPFLTLMFTGPGKWSADFMLRRKL